MVFTSSRVELLLLSTVVLAVCLSLFIEIDTGANWFFWGPFFDAGHYPLFFLCTVVGLRFSRILPNKMPNFLRLPYLPLAAFVVLVELIQPYFERSASIVDVQNGLLGIAAAGIVSQGIKQTRSQLMRLIILGFAATLIIPLLWPIKGSFHAIQWRERSLPSLAEFSDPAEKLLWGDLEPKSAQFKDYSKLRFVKADWLNSKTGLFVSTSSGYYAGVAYAAGDLNWANYSKLQLLVFNPDREPFTLFMRIDDPDKACNKMGGRFNKGITLRPGPNLIETTIRDIENGPKKRKLDITRIRDLIIFVDKNDKSRRFIIDEARLL